MTLGGKYKHTVNTNPPPGYYDPNAADKLTKTKSQAVLFNKTDAKLGGRLGKNDFTKLKMAENPSPGEYDGHLTAFGADKKNNITIGKKYKQKYNNNPPPGLYDPERAANVTKPRIQSAVIKAPEWYKV